MDHRSGAAGRARPGLKTPAAIRRLLAALLCCFLSMPALAADADLEGIVDLLDPDYQQRPINVARLPLKVAITTRHGRGERVVYTFEDPNCGYCRQLNVRLEEIGNLTVHTFVIALLGDDSRTKADAAWCAPNRTRAWRETMRKKPIPPAPAGCRAPTAETAKIVEMLGINLTPTLFFADGSRMNGIKPRAEIEARLKAAAVR